MVTPVHAEGRCFGECDCSCGVTCDAFDLVAARELRERLRLQELLRRNIAWYCDRNIADAHVELWNLGRGSGLYFLWHKDDYCPVHERFHMRALYVGKGAFSRRCGGIGTANRPRNSS